MLFVPGGNEKLLSKSLSLDVDSIIIDLEDSVAPQMKNEARKQAAKAFEKEDFRGKEKVVRVNSLKTDYGYDDLSIMLKSNADTFLIPKVDGPDDIKEVDCIISKFKISSQANIELIALIETPKGVLNTDQIAFCNQRLTGLLFGSGDFVRETRGRITPDRRELYYPLTKILLASRAANIDAIDSPYFNIKNPQGLSQHTMQAKLLGYDGKAIIHPNQVEIVNQIFTPDDDEISLAKRIIEAHDKAISEGKGATTVDGELVENVHAIMAQRTLCIARKAGKY